MHDPADVLWERGLRAAALGGDAAAWRTLFDSAFETVASFARWRCGGREDLAEDVVQEAWLTAARRLSRFEPERCRFAGWVCGIAANIARAAVRRRLKDAGRSRPLVGVPEPAAASAEPAPDPERVALALSELPQRYEAVLRQKYFEQMSVADIANANRDSPKAVESLLTRARQAFREAFARNGDPP